LKAPPPSRDHFGGAMKIGVCGGQMGGAGG